MIGRTKSKDGAKPEDIAAGTAGSVHIVAGATVVADEQIPVKLDESQRRYACNASSENVYCDSRESEYSAEQHLSKDSPTDCSVSCCDRSDRELLGTFGPCR